MADLAYPKRPAFFAAKFVRKMIKMCVAQEHGQGVFTLLAIIAHTEDARQYIEPVTWWNEQLASVAGFANVKALDRQRQKAIDAGWLGYIAGGRSRPGKYWVMVPERYRNLDDRPTDEGADDDAADFCSPVTVQKTPNKVGNKPGGNRGDNREVTGEVTGREVGNKPGGNRATSLPIPNPDPNPIPPSPLYPPEGGREDALFQIDQKLIAWWNALPGVKHTSRRALTPAQRRLVEGWVVNGFDWEAVGKCFPLKVTEGRTGADGAWMPSLTWFLEEGHAEAILDGKYDFTIADKSKPSGRKAEPGQIHDPSKPAEVGVVHW